MSMTHSFIYRNSLWIFRWQHFGGMFLSLGAIFSNRLLYSFQVKHPSLNFTMGVRVLNLQRLQAGFKGFLNQRLRRRFSLIFNVVSGYLLGLAFKLPTLTHRSKKRRPARYPHSCLDFLITKRRRVYENSPAWALKRYSFFTDRIRVIFCERIRLIYE